MPSSEAIWYYAQDDREHGPVSAAYIAGMARTGKLRPEDLVWREGMEDWRPARAIKGLFSPAERPAGATSDTAVLDSPFDALPPTKSVAPERTEKTDAHPRAVAPSVEAGDARETESQPAPPPVESAQRVANRPATEFDAGGPSQTLPTHEFAAASTGAMGIAGIPAEVFQRSGRILVIAGLLLALFSRGCDFAAQRSLARLDAKAQLAEFQSTLASSAPQITPTPTERLAMAAQKARLTNQAWEFWRAVCFVVGTVLFAVGLFPLALSGNGADRWLGIVLLAVLAFAVFSQRAP
jgi:hypothetical protein